MQEQDRNPLDDARSLYSDLYKDRYNVRPRGYSHLTLAELEAEIERISALEIEEQDDWTLWVNTD